MSKNSSVAGAYVTKGLTAVGFITTMACQSPPARPAEYPPLDTVPSLRETAPAAETDATSAPRTPASPTSDADAGTADAGEQASAGKS